MKTPRTIITLNQASIQWSRIPRLRPRLETAATVTLAHLPKALQFPVTVTLLLTTNAAIRRLNRDFRGMDKPTNVLSFPQYEPDELKKMIRRERNAVPLPPLREGLGEGGLGTNLNTPSPNPSRKGGRGAVPLELGDIAIAYQYIVVEAKNDHKILINHIIHLFIHGLLHLFGYDHILDPEAGRMERLETKIMAALDLPDPYAPAHLMEPKRKRKPASKRRAGLHPGT